MYLDTLYMIDRCIKEINKKRDDFNHLNIIIAGKTGVGKSTLINYIFNDQLAETGIGEPVTQHIQEISKRDVPLTLYDTKGLELSREIQKKIKYEIVDKIKEGIRTKDLNKCIHCIWYCISTVSDRIEDAEIEWIKELSEKGKKTKVPIVILLTKSFSKKKAIEFANYINSLKLSVCAIVPILALDYYFENDYVVKAYGGEELIEIMGKILKEELEHPLLNHHNSRVKQKVESTPKIITTTGGNNLLKILEYGTNRLQKK